MRTADMGAAFHGSTATKERLVDAVAVGLGQLPSPLEDWASISILTVGSDDAVEYASATGYPLSLAVFQDRIFGPLVGANDETSRRELAFAHAKQWLSVVPPGSNLDAAPIGILSWMLGELSLNCALGQRCPALHTLLEDVLASHQKHLASGSVGRKEWAELRARVALLTQALEDPRLGWVSEAVESAAWDPTRSRVILADVLENFCSMRSEQALIEWGWTEEEEIYATSILQGIYEETQPLREAGGDVNIPELFKQRRPEVEARYVRHLQVAQEGRTQATAEVYRQAVIELERAGAMQ